MKDHSNVSNAFARSILIYILSDFALYFLN